MDKMTWNNVQICSFIEEFELPKKFDDFVEDWMKISIEFHWKHSIWFTILNGMAYWKAGDSLKIQFVVFIEHFESSS